MIFVSKSAERYVFNTLEMLNSVESGGEEVAYDLKNNSVIAIPPVLGLLPFLGIRPSIHIYRYIYICNILFRANA